MKTILTISKKWNQPTITQELWKEGENESGDYVKLSMSLEDFVVALKKEIGSVATVITKAGIEDRIDKAIATIVYDIKSEWVKHPY